MFVGVAPKATVEPFLKWAGGKRLLLDRVLPHVPHPEPGGRYYEPFLGGGAVFFGLGLSGPAQLSDLNRELIETFCVVRDGVDDLIQALQQLEHSSARYYHVRSTRPRSAVKCAARFIYLNKTCFNGLYRVNLNGEFNVPFGRHGSNLEICNTTQLRQASLRLRTTRLKCIDFEIAVKEAKAGDVVYFDPPYTVAHSQNGFVEYNARVFRWSDQRRLARRAAALVKNGVAVAVSNGLHPSILDLYPQRLFDRVSIERWSTMAGSGAKRFRGTELLLVGRPK